MYCTYILQSTVTGRYYTGSTEDLENRVNEHNTGETPSIRSGIPWKVVHVEYFPKRAVAMRRERQIKSRGAKRYLEDLKIKNNTQ
jgi:putative endonuclease